MLNEFEEFRAYIEPPIYKADSKRDTTYMGRFSMDMILDFTGLARVLTVLARGYLFADADENLRARINYARRALCAWCSVPDKKKASPKEEWQFKSDFRELHGEFLELVDEDGMGWFCRHVHGIARFMKNNPDKVSKTAYGKADVIDKEFDAAWRKKVVQFQVPIFSQGTSGAWVLRFDDVLADALELGPLRNNSIDLPDDILDRIEELRSEKVPTEVICTLVAYYIANKPEDSEWVVLPVTNFDAYFGSTMFSRKWLPAIPESIIMR
uniref:hypothetical protein n=1 Tax=Acutalibacter caecimuris TaxID=3093657 RepID=UPI002AC8A3EC